LNSLRLEDGMYITIGEHIIPGGPSRLPNFFQGEVYSYVGPIEVPDLGKMAGKTSEFRTGPISEVGIVINDGFDMKGVRSQVIYPGDYYCEQFKNDRARDFIGQWTWGRLKSMRVIEGHEVELFFKGDCGKTRGTGKMYGPGVYGKID